MGKIGICFAFIVLMSGVVLGQSTEKPTEFEAADVHTSPISVFAQMSGPVIRTGQYEIRNASMVDLIKTAYDVSDDKVVGGPSWLDTDRFDVLAKTRPARQRKLRKRCCKACLPTASN